MATILELKDGNKMPVIGLGTLLHGPDFDADEVVKAIENAIDIGYRHIDTAWLYMTEKAVGRAVKNKINSGVIKREDIFITTKLWITFLDVGLVREGLKTSLQNLGLDYIDLYLIHAPYAQKMPNGNYHPYISKENPEFQEVDLIATWKELEACVQEGLIKSIGVSNFNSRQVKLILDQSHIPPVVNQCEVHVYFQNKQLVNNCQDNGVAMVAFSPLGQFPEKYQPSGWTSSFVDKTITDIAGKHNKTPAQICLKYQLQRGIVVIPMSLIPTWQKENLELFDFDLSTEDMERIAGIDKNIRVYTFSENSSHPGYPFHDPY